MLSECDAFRYHDAVRCSDVLNCIQKFSGMCAFGCMMHLNFMMCLEVCDASMSHDWLRCMMHSGVFLGVWCVQDTDVLF